jgi:hypothetical protein
MSSSIEVSRYLIDPEVSSFACILKMLSINLGIPSWKLYYRSRVKVGDKLLIVGEEFASEIFNLRTRIAAKARAAASAVKTEETKAKLAWIYTLKL